MPGSSNKPKPKAGGPASKGGKRAFSPMIIAAIVVLAIVVVGALAVVAMRTVGGSGNSTAATAGIGQGTSVGPADAKVVVLNFSDFQ